MEIQQHSIKLIFIIEDTYAKEKEIEDCYRMRKVHARVRRPPLTLDILQYISCSHIQITVIRNITVNRNAVFLRSFFDDFIISVGS